MDLYHRSDCCQSRLVGSQLIISSTTDFSTGIVCATLDEPRSVPESNACGDGLVGQFVTVHNPDSPQLRSLTICEIDIWGFRGTPGVAPGALMDRSGNNRAAIIQGNAYVDSSGLHLDGDGDFAALADFDYETDGSFSVSVWARKSACFAASNAAAVAWETMYAHVRDASWGVNQPDNSQLLMQLGCGMDAGVHDNAFAGSFLRVTLVGSGRQFVTFDHYLNHVGWNNWVSLVLSVDRSAVALYEDGQQVEDTAISLYNQEPIWRHKVNLAGSPRSSAASSSCTDNLWQCAGSTPGRGSSVSGSVGATTLSQLSGQFAGFDFRSLIFLGTDYKLRDGRFFMGDISGLGIYGTPIGSNIAVVFQSEQVSSDFVSIPTTSSNAGGRCSSCANGIMDSDETDIDCGGSICPRCTPTQTCQYSTDCASAQCDSGVCVSCDNGVMDGAETDIDCGGLCPEPCGPTQTCVRDSDCATGDCVAAISYESALIDQVLPGCITASGTSVASGTICPDYATASLCEAACTLVQACGGCTQRTAGGNWQLSAFTIARPLSGATTHLKTTVGSTCSVDVSPNLVCFNEAHDSDEAGVDCGGICRLVGKLCMDGASCSADLDCESAKCEAGSCVSCRNAFVDGSETDLDCGGDTCERCVDGSVCRQDSDCASSLCGAGICISCHNGRQDGTETDIDCGGTCAQSCPVGGSCAADSDCQTGKCDLQSTYTGPYADTYLPGCAGTPACQGFSTQTECETACSVTPGCGGCTREGWSNGHDWHWELRAGATGRTSSYEETSTVRSASTRFQLI